MKSPVSRNFHISAQPADVVARIIFSRQRNKGQLSFLPSKSNWKKFYRNNNFLPKSIDRAQQTQNGKITAMGQTK
jgi:hypothetical protein